MVLSQTPSAGTMLHYGSVINVVVAVFFTICVLTMSGLIAAFSLRRR